MPNYIFASVYVDLLDTTLEDFIVLGNNAIMGIAGLGLRDFEGGNWKEVEPRQLERWLKHYTKVTNWQLQENAYGGDIYITVSCAQEGATSCRWYVEYPRQREYPGLKRATGKSDFWIEATHYRRGYGLNVAMWEEHEVEPVLGGYLLDWLKQHWRDDGIDDLLAKGEQSPDPPNGNRPSSYGDKRARSTLVHHLVTKYNQDPSVALGLVDDITKATYETHVEKGLLLSEEDFAKLWSQDNPWGTETKTLDAEARWRLGLQK